ncbi:MAG: flagellar hook-basal body complex protein FliE [Armatimonadota bacterium]
MRIGDSPSLTYLPQQVQRKAPVELDNQANSTGIGQRIEQAITNVNDLQKNADNLIERVAAGNTDETHKAMVAMEHALLALDFTLQVRNKILDAYQEIMKTQL